MVRFGSTARRFFTLTLGAAAVALTLSQAARAERFIPIGARQRAMGGAGVAATEDATSIYWNPANLALRPLNRAPRPADEDRQEADAKALPHAGTMTAEEEEKLGKEGEGEKLEGRDADKWAGYHTIDLQIAANLELFLTGDVVARLDRIDKLVTESDVDGAAERASQVPPTLTQQDFRNLVRLYQEINDLDQGGDALGELGGGVFFRAKWFGVGVYTNSYVGVRPRTNLDSKSGFSSIANAEQLGQALIITQGTPTTPPTTGGGQQLAQDLVNIGLSQQSANALSNLAEQSGVNLDDPSLREALQTAAQLAGTGDVNAITNNDSGARVRGLSTQELAVSFSMSFLDDHISLGVSPKLMNGITAERNYFISNFLTGGETFDSATDGFVGTKEQTLTFGVDAGITIQIADMIRVGVVGRNLNSPRFKFKERSPLDGKRTWELEPQLRAGIAIKPVESFTLTVDGDLLRNKSVALPGVESQMIGGGVEFAPDFGFVGLAFRAGAYGDVEDLRDDWSPILTAGFGLRIAMVTIDLGASMALKREEFRDQEVPRDAGLAAQIGLAF